MAFLSLLGNVGQHGIDRQQVLRPAFQPEG
jgi:hypothetical protein